MPPGQQLRATFPQRIGIVITLGGNAGHTDRPHNPINKVLLLQLAQPAIDARRRVVPANCGLPLPAGAPIGEMQPLNRLGGQKPGGAEAVEDCNIAFRNPETGRGAHASSPNSRVSSALPGRLTSMDAPPSVPSLSLWPCAPWPVDGAGGTRVVNGGAGTFPIVRISASVAVGRA